MTTVLIAIAAVTLFVACGTDEPGGSTGGSNTPTYLDGGNDGSGGDDVAIDGSAADTGGSQADTTAGDTSSGDTNGGDADGVSGDTGPTSCLSDADCPGNKVCTVDRSGNMIEMVCKTPDSNDGDVGDSCMKDDDCKSNLCLNGQCTKPCQRPIDCSKDGSWTCKSKSVSTQGGGSQMVNVCVPTPAKACQTDGDCAGMKKCIAKRGQKKIEFVCGQQNPGGGSIGDSCTKDGDCARNLCVDGKCTGPCRSKKQCSSANWLCKTTMVDVGHGNTDSASICVEPRPCDEKDQCKVGEVCYFKRSMTNSAGRCRQPNPGGKSLGDVCQKDGQCAANLCYDGRFRKICSVACKDASDCKTGFRCKSKSIADGMGGMKTAKICVPAPPKTCNDQSECGMGTVCGIVPKVSGSGLEAVCMPDPGGLTTGNACNKDSDCKSLVCLNGSCSSPCTNRSQCANNQICRSNTIKKNNQSGSFQVCETLPTQKCSSTGTCNDPIRMCSSIKQSMGTYEAYCQFPTTGTGKLGDSCSKDNDCKSGFCLSSFSSSLTGHCSVACRNDVQCGSNQICTSMPFSSTNFASCMKPCSTTADCSGTNTCQTNENQMTTPYSVDSVCMKRGGMKVLGETCSFSSNKCKSNLCLNTYTFKRGHANYKQCTPGQNQCASGWGCHQDPGASNQYYCAEEDHRCTKLCTQNSDCNGGVSGHPLTSCESDITLTLSDNSTTQIKACANP